MNMKVIPQQAVLSNGVRILMQPLPHRPAAVGIWLHGGTRHEAVQQQGYTHLFEHLLFCGAHRLDETALLDRLQALGGQVNAVTTAEFMALYGLVPGAAAHELLQLFCTMLMHSHWDEAQVRREAEFVCHEMASQSSLAQARRLLWGDHPLARSANLDDLARLVRIDLSALHAHRQILLQGRRLLVVAAGDIDPGLIIRSCHKLEDLPAGTAWPPQPPVPVRHAQTQLSQRPEHLLWVMPACAANAAERPVWELMQQWLGADFASLIPRCLRQAGLAYEAQSGLELYTDAGLFHLQVAARAGRGEDCLTQVDTRLNICLEQGLSAAQLRTARLSWLARWRLTQDDPLAVIEQLAAQTMAPLNYPLPEAVMQIEADQLVQALETAWRQRIILGS
jgi:predicted Zn-dependent peptidase